MDELELRQRLAQYKFYHIIQLTESIATPGNPEFLKIQAPVLKAIGGLDLRGKRVLDVGCRDGLYSFAAERLGAAEVIGIDNDLSKGAVDFLIPYFGSAVRMYEVSIYDVNPDRFGKFDAIIFAGVLYHLRHPFWALKILRDVSNPKAILIVETAIFYGVTKHAMLFCPVGNESPYEPTSCTFFNKKGLLDTLSSFGWRTLSASVLHPEAEAANQLSPDPVVDRVVLVCEFSGQCPNTLVDRYWHGKHDISSRYGGVREGALAGDLFRWDSG